jgi:transcriptional regulator with XRE-family HTH domain
VIRNERQYHTTLRQRRLLADALETLARHSREPEPDDQELDRVRLYRSSVISRLAELDAQLHEYELLRAGAALPIRVTSFAELPDALIRARIGSGLSERDLAGRLGVEEEQVQHYEADLYADTSLRRLRAVSEALGVEMRGDIRLPPAVVPLNRLRNRLLDLGVDRWLIDQRLLRNLTGQAGQIGVLAAAERIARLLAMPVHQLLSATDPPSAPETVVWSDTYVRYAKGLAGVVRRGTLHLPPTRAPGDAGKVRRAIDGALAALAPDRRSAAPDSEILLRVVLQYAAEIGVPVLGLQAPGASSGACFTTEGRSVIVIKHTSDSAAHWLAMLLHELGHLIGPGYGGPRTRIESDPIERGYLSRGGTDDPEERRAAAFCTEVLFHQGPDAVLNQALTTARGSVSQLAVAVPAVAESAGMPVDILAVFLAAELARRGIDWWGAAGMFQRVGAPRQVVIDHLTAQLDFNSLDSVDRTALIDALGAYQGDFKVGR